MLYTGAAEKGIVRVESLPVYVQEDPIEIFGEF